MTVFEPIFGRCECGSVRFKVDAPALEMYHCHCARCRRLHGTLFATYACIRTDNLVIDHGAENLATYSSPRAHWFFVVTAGVI